MFRTHDCNSLRRGDIGKQVTLAGWVNVTRDHGGVIFIDLRDRAGLTQVVFRPEENAELAKQAHTLRSEDVIQVSGRVAARVPGTENSNLATGEIEVAAYPEIVWDVMAGIDRWPAWNPASCWRSSSTKGTPS